MVEQFRVHEVLSIWYGLIASIFKLVKGSGAAVIREASKSTLDYMGLPKASSFPEVADNLAGALEGAGFVVKCTLNNLDLEAGRCYLYVEECKFWDSAERLLEEGIPIAACPVVNLCIAYIERDLAYRARTGKITCKDGKGNIELMLFKK